MYKFTIYPIQLLSLRIQSERQYLFLNIFNIGSNKANFIDRISTVQNLKVIFKISTD